jgi:hypothetical protein
MGEMKKLAKTKGFEAGLQPHDIHKHLHLLLLPFPAVSLV